MRANIFYASSNRHKVNEFNAALKPYNYRAIQVTIDYNEPESDSTYIVPTIARQKALEAFAILSSLGLDTHDLIITNDTGFEIDALDGRPGAMVKRSLERYGIQGILDEVNNIKDAPRTCRFVESTAIMSAQMQEPLLYTIQSAGVIEATASFINPEIATAMKSDFWRIFKPEGASKVLSEMNLSEFNDWLELSGRLKHSSEAQIVEWMVQNKCIENGFSTPSYMRK